MLLPSIKFFSESITSWTLAKVSLRRATFSGENKLFRVLKRQRTYINANTQLLKWVQVNRVKHGGTIQHVSGVRGLTWWGLAGWVRWPRPEWNRDSCRWLQWLSGQTQNHLRTLLVDQMAIEHASPHPWMCRCRNWSERPGKGGWKKNIGITFTGCLTFFSWYFGCIFSALHHKIQLK